MLLPQVLGYLVSSGVSLSDILRAPGNWAEVENLMVDRLDMTIKVRETMKGFGASSMSTMNGSSSSMTTCSSNIWRRSWSESSILCWHVLNLISEMSTQERILLSTMAPHGRLKALVVIDGDSSKRWRVLVRDMTEKSVALASQKAVRRWGSQANCRSSEADISTSCQPRVDHRWSAIRMLCVEGILVPWMEFWISTRWKSDIIPCMEQTPRKIFGRIRSRLNERSKPWWRYIRLR